jgi:hypothetical protein
MLAQLRYTPMGQRAGMQKLLIDGRQLVGELSVQVFNDL